MALTPSRMLPLGTTASKFILPATDGSWVRLESFSQQKLLVVAFICNHCPFVKHIRSQLAQMGRDYQERGVGFVAINSNDIVAVPADNMQNMQQEAKSVGYTFPYLLDESQSVAHAYDAACTPDFYLFDSARKLIYRGQLDGSRPSNDVPVDGKELRSAINAAINGEILTNEQKPSIGCNIKWRPGNEPV